MQALLNLFVVGAAKSGTTSLWGYLKNHPEIYMPTDIVFKEPAYFSERQIGFNWENYMKLFDASSGDEKYLGEASTAYLTDPSCAQRIFEYNPDCRILIMLRNPTERAHSLYKWMVQEGYEYAQSFETALDMEANRRQQSIPNSKEIEYYYNYLYRESGFYHSQVKRYLDTFGPERIFVSCFEDFVKDQEQTLRQICEFLDVPYLEHAIEGHHENVSREVYSAWLQHKLRLATIGLIRRRILNPNNKGRRDFLLNLGLKPFARKKRMKAETRANLQECFLPDVEQLAQATGIDFIQRWYRHF